jgi:hypothetical protein
MRRLRRRVVSRPRAVLCGAVALYALSQLALGLFLTRAHPEVREPEYGSLCKTLEARLAESPGRPLVLVLGSSRSANIFRPPPPGPDTPAGPDPLVFNCATLCTGPVRELQMLHRLLARGVRPAWVVAEVWAPFLTQRGAAFAEEPFIARRDLQPVDRAVVGRYFADPAPAYHELMMGVLAPAFTHRVQLLAAYSPFVERPAPYVTGDWSNPILRKEGFGWLPVPDARPDPDVLRVAVARYADMLRGVLADFRVSPAADGALRELLETCARHGTRVAFVMLPEHCSMRACITPAVEARVHAYLGELTRPYGAAVIDTRDWIGDDDFIDSGHALPHVAGPYTERFLREALRPLREGRPLPPHLLPGSSPAPAAGTGSGA